MKVKLFLLVISIMALISFSCEKEKLTELDKYQLIQNQTVNAEVDFCTMKADKVKSNLKFVFVIDKSGSNQDLTDALGTDPNGDRRYVPLLLYLNETESDPTIFYSLINLHTEADLITGFINDKDRFQEIVENEANPNNAEPPRPADGGWTDFEKSVERVTTIIDEDIRAAKVEPEVVSSYYVVIFISDGAPWVREEIQSKVGILEQVRGLLAYEEGNKEYVDSIQLHTGYYYNDNLDNDAQTYMKEMAEMGNGDAFEFGSGQVIDFSQFSVPERNVKHLLRDVIVTNVNTKWYLDELTLDSDGDGLVDRLEDELGSHRLIADSDGNGISDGVEYFLTTRPCRDPLCDPENAEPYEACNKWEVPDEELPDGDFDGDFEYESEVGDSDVDEVESEIEAVETDNSDEDILVDDENALPNVPVRKLSDLDKDFLNDCEERIILKSKMENFDSNEDWIPDGLAFRGSLAFVEGTSQEAFLDPDWDTVDNYMEIKTNTPIRYDNRKIYGLKPYKYKIETVSDDHAQSCFHLKVEQIPIGSENDIIRVYLLENTSVINNRRFMRTAEKHVTPGEKTVEFVVEDFISEE